MINLDYNHISQILHIKNDYEENMTFDVWVKDIETHCYSHSFWVKIPSNNSHWYDFGGNFLIQSNGAIFEVYFKENMILSKEFIWGELNDHLKLSTPKQLVYGHWIDLLNKPTLNITDQDVVYDLGANYGTFSLWAKNAKQVYAFEPTPSIIPYLKSSFKDQKNIKIFDKAIGALHNSTVPFYVTPSHSSSTFIKKQATAYGTEKVEVQVINLEQFSKENNLLPPTILKCDIEGLEWEFINSLSDDFFKTIKQINLEFHFISEENLGKMLLRFLELGFEINVKEGICKNRMMGTLILNKDPNLTHLIEKQKNVYV